MTPAPTTETTDTRAIRAGGMELTPQPNCTVRIVRIMPIDHDAVIVAYQINGVPRTRSVKVRLMSELRRMLAILPAGPPASVALLLSDESRLVGFYAGDPQQVILFTD